MFSIFGTNITVSSDRVMVTNKPDGGQLNRDFFSPPVIVLASEFRLAGQVRLSRPALRSALARAFSTPRLNLMLRRGGSSPSSHFPRYRL